jgi:O-antigen/teichoic acid export membrane protein
MLSSNLSTQLIGFVSTMVLVRLLSPSDFGMLAMVMATVSFLRLTSAVGVESYLIQDQDAKSDIYNTAWTVNFILFICAGLILFLGAPYIAIYYKAPEIERATQFISLVFLLHALKNIWIVDFRKHLLFSKEFRYNISVKISSVIPTLLLAYFLRSYWALLVGIVIAALAEIIISYTMYPRRPRLSMVGIRKIFHYTKWTSIHNFFVFVNMQGPIIVLGRYLSAEKIGIFSVSLEIATVLTSQLASAINAAAFPVFSKLTNDPPKLRASVRRVSANIFVLFAPIGVGIFAVSDQFVTVVLGSQWNDAGEVLKYLALYGVVIGTLSLNGYAFLAIGKPRIVTLLSFILGSIVLVASFYGGLTGSVTSTVQWLFFGSLVLFPINGYFLNRYIGLGLRESLSDRWRAVVACAIMYAIVTGSKGIISRLVVENHTMLGISVIIGICVYTCAVLLLWLLSGRPAGAERTFLEQGLRILSRRKVGKL